MNDFSGNHRVIAYSLRHGYPNKQILDSTADFSINQNVRDLTELVKALKLEPIHLVGHSSRALVSSISYNRKPGIGSQPHPGGTAGDVIAEKCSGGDTLEMNFGKAITPGIEAILNKEDEKRPEFLLTL